MTEHAKFSPSGAHRWIKCPGSIRLSEGIESKPSTYALEGTELHSILEMCLRDKLDPYDLCGDNQYVMTNPEDPDWSMEFDEEHAEAVRSCMDEIYKLSKEYNITHGMLETRVEINDDCFGTVDVPMWNDEVVLVIDAKFGRGKSVEAEGNAQGMLYAIGLLRRLHADGVKIPNRVVIVILQPRIPPTRRLWEISTIELNTWYKKSVLPAIEEAKNGNAVCNPGEEQCQFCPANAICTARANYLLGIVEDEFKPYAIDENTSLPAIPKQVVDLKDKMAMTVDTITPEIASKILKYRPDFDNFFKRIGEWALKSARDGVEIPGYKLVHGRSNRKWINPDNAEVVIVAHIGEKAFTKKLISPAQAEKKIKSVDLSNLIEKPLGKVILVDESDTREPVDLTLESDFEEFAVTKDLEPVSYPTGQAETVTSNDPVETVEVFTDTSEIDDIMKDFNVEEDESTHETILHGNNPSPPNNKTKKYKLMMMGKEGGVSIQEAAEKLFNGSAGQVKRGLHQLNERDGYTVIFHTDNTFTVKE